MATIQGVVTLPHGIEIDPNYRYMSALSAMKIPAYQTMDAHIGWRVAKTSSTDCGWPQSAAALAY